VLLVFARRTEELEEWTLLELYLRLSSIQEMDWKGRGQFIAVAAQMMRRILIDHARKRRAAKRQAVLEVPPGAAGSNADVLDVDRALQKMAAEFPRHAQVVELRFFGGLDAPEIARTMDLSLRTVERDWQFSKAWLQRELSGF
jgi:RNA polymerase sigma factor (TIGR02999 family)